MKLHSSRFFGMLVSCAAMFTLSTHAHAQSSGATLELVPFGAYYSYIQTLANGQTITVMMPMTPTDTGEWEASQPIGENGCCGFASTTLKVKTLGDKVVVVMHHHIESTDANANVSTNGQATIKLKLTAAPNGAPSGSITNETTRSVFSEVGVNASATLKTYTVGASGVPWFQRESQRFASVNVGGIVNLGLLKGSATLTGVGTFDAETSLFATAGIAQTGVATPPVYPYPILDETDDAEDDEADDDGCPKSAEGDNLHLHLTTGAIQTRVPICKSYANGEPEFDLEYRYDSRRAYESRNWAQRANGWSSPYGVFLKGSCDPNLFGYAVYHDETGRRNLYRFYQNLYVTPMGRGSILFWGCGIAGGSQPGRLIKPDGTTYYFGTDGQVQKMTDRRGRTYRWHYPDETHPNQMTIESPYGRFLTFTTVSADQTRITDPDGKVTLVDFHPTTRDLIRVTDPLNNSVEFEYDPVVPHRMIREKLKNNTVYTAEFTSPSVTPAIHSIKDSKEHIVVQVECAAGFPLRDRDQMVAADVIYTDGRGKQWTVRRDHLGRIWEVVAPQPPGDLASNRKAYLYGGRDSQYDRNRLIQTFTDTGAGLAITESHYDAYGNVLNRTDAEGNIETFVYNNTGWRDRTRLTDRNAPVGSDGVVRQWTYTYDNNTSDLRSVIDPIRESPDKVVEHVYENHPDAAPFPPSDLAGGGRIKKITTTDRNGNQTIKDFSADGRLTQMTRGAGAGQLNLVTSYEYDSCGRQKEERIVRDGDLTIRNQTTYDAMGRVIDTIEDAGENRLNLTTHRIYDGYGNLTDIDNPRGFRTHYDYDYRNRLKKQTVDQGGLALVTEWEYDGNSNVTSITDPKGHVTAFEYNDENFLVKRTDAAGYVTLYEPDALGHNWAVRRAVQPGPEPAPADLRSVHYLYDMLGRMTKRWVVLGETELATYFDYSVPSGATGCGCQGATPGTDMPRKITDPDGRKTFYNYDKLDRLVSIVREMNRGEADENPLGVIGRDSITNLEYDYEGNLTWLRGPEGETTQFVYDQADRRYSKTVYAPGQEMTTIYARDEADNVKTVILPTGNTLTLTYDAANRLTSTVDPLGPVSSTGYDANGNATSRCDGLGHCWSFVYDHADRLSEAHDPVVESPDRFTIYEYDSAGNLEYLTDNNGVQTKYVYDNIDRLLQTIENFHTSPPSGDDSANTTTTYGYDGINQISIADHDGNTTFYHYDDANRLYEIVYPPPGGTVTYQYHPSGDLWKRTDQRNYLTQFEYDDLHQLQKKTYYVPNTDPRVEDFVFDRSGRIKRARNGENAEFGVDATFQYDIAGRRTQAVQTFTNQQGAAATYTLTYENFVAPNDVSRVIHYPGGARTVTEKRDLRNRLAIVKDGETDLITWAFDLANRRTQATRSNGVRDSFGYDLDDRLTGISTWLFPAGGDPSPVDLRDYAYDAVGNRRFTRLSPAGTNDQSDRSELYSHDPRNRLRSMARGQLNGAGTAVETPIQNATRPASQLWTGLDHRGNWTEFAQTIGATTATQTRTPNDMNQYTAIDLDGPGGAAPLAPTHDAAGNLSVDPSAIDACGYQGLKYEYDEENRLTKVRRANNTILMEINYDALGRRVQSRTYCLPSGSYNASGVGTRYVYDGLQVIQEIGTGIDQPDAWGVLNREFIWGDANRFPESVAMVNTNYGSPEIFHYLHDVLGSVTGLTDESGALVERYGYDPYGKTYAETSYLTNGVWNPTTASAVGNPFAWTGQRYDAAVGLYHFLFRSYSPALGQWMQEDPAGFVDGVNLFQYLSSNTFSRRDRFGLEGSSLSDVQNVPLLIELYGEAGAAEMLGASAEAIAAAAAAAELLKQADRLLAEAERQLARTRTTTGGPPIDKCMIIRKAIDALEKGIESFERNIEEHKKKIDEYLKDPDAHDNDGRLKNAPNDECRKKIIEGRKNALEKQIRKNEINKEQAMRQRNELQRRLRNSGC